MTDWRMSERLEWGDDYFEDSISESLQSGLISELAVNVLYTVMVQVRLWRNSLFWRD